MKFADVSPFDELFTHVADDEAGTQTTYNVSRLFDHIAGEAQHGVKRVTVPVEEHHAEYCAERRGVEHDRLDYLVANPEHLQKPILFVHMPDGSHLLVDGTHRYVLYWMVWEKMGKPDGMEPRIPAYIVSWAVAAPFVVDDMPHTAEDVLMAWSGLTVMRQLRGPLSVN